MLDFVRSLPQGLLWYPAVIVLAVMAVRPIARLVRSSGKRRRHRSGGASRLEAYDDRIRSESTDAALERSCIGMLLVAHGYSGYSIANCRDYLSHGADETIQTALSDHLTGAPDRAAESGLPSRIETVLTHIETQLEE
jgi:hypothetical protein